MDFFETIELERKLLDPTVRKNKVELGEILSDDFWEIGTSGRTYDKKLTIELLSQDDGVPMTAVDFTGVQLAPDIVQLRFQTMSSHPDGTVSRSLRSSIWKRIGSRWQLYFHQGTRVS